MMKGLKSQFVSASIRTKLVLMLVLCTALALGTGVALLMANTVSVFRSEAQQSAEHLANLLVEFSVAPLSFNDPKGAEEVLERLASIHAVEVAAIFDLHSKLFAKYVKQGSTAALPPMRLPPYSGFDDGFLDVSQPISFRGQRFGVVALRLSTLQLRQKVTEFVLSIGLVLIGVMLFSFLIALRLQRFISEPILNLAGAARKVSKDADYSVRVVRSGEDEIADLYTAFNQMLGQIDSRQQERERAESMLRESEKKFRDIVQDQTELLCRYTKEGVLLFVNEAYCKFFGRSSQDLLGRSFFDFVSHAERERLLKHLASLTLESPVASHEQLMTRSDGEARWVHWTDRAIVDDNGAISEYQGVGRDINELKRAEEEKERLSQQLEHAHRMETIGTLAGGIAHDFNNILTPLLGCLEMASIEAVGNDKILPILGTARESAERAKDLVSQILTFSRVTAECRRPIHLEEVVEKALRLLRASIPASIRIEKDIRAQLGLVMADAAKVHQTVMNLCTNAFQAMTPQGGTLHISLRSLDLNADNMPLGSSLSPGRYVKLSVRDTGCGMDKATLKRIFEPFFTTKPVGMGTGLGLSVVHGIVSSLHGHISVESRPGHGSCFEILLPETTEHEVDVPVPDTMKLQESGRILLVDDEEVICQVTKALLERFGYTVDAHMNPRDAFEAFKRNPNAYDILITDQTMPHMSGIELARSIHQLRPDLPAILTSGYGPEIPKAEELNRFGIFVYLMKPYSMEELRRNVQAVLHKDVTGQPPSGHGIGGVVQ